MRLASKTKKLINNPWILYSVAAGKGLTNRTDDDQYLKNMWKASFGGKAELNLENPRTFNEKLQWLKLYDRNPAYVKMVDKYLAKQWAASIIGDEHIVPAYAVWERAEDIDISELPDQFVLKTNHDCGGIAICADKSTFDFEAARNKLGKHLNRNYYYWGREWPYKNVKPVVFAEKYLDPGEERYNGGLEDYKLFRFSNGRIITLVCEDRFSGAGLKKTFFDEGWHPLDVLEGGHEANTAHPAPEHFEWMKKMADSLAAGMPFCRVDFFESNGQCYFGEMTFFPNSGFERFDPEEWNAEFGSWIDLQWAYCYKKG